MQVSGVDEANDANIKLSLSFFEKCVDSFVREPSEFTGCSPNSKHYIHVSLCSAAAFGLQPVIKNLGTCILVYKQLYLLPGTERIGSLNGNKRLFSRPLS